MAKRKGSDINQVTDDEDGIRSWSVAEASDLAQRRKKKPFASPAPSVMSSLLEPPKNNGAKACERNRQKQYNICMEKLNSAWARFLESVNKNDPNLDTMDLSPNLELYKLHASTLEHRYVRKTGNTLAMCGSGDCGQLGLGEKKLDASVPKVIKEGLLDGDNEADDDAIIDVACGGLHNLALTKSGNVYSFGCNDDGSLGSLSVKGTAYEPVLVSTGKYGFLLPDGKVRNETILQVATGDCQSLALSLNGNIYFWGSYKDKEGKQFRHMTPENDVRKWPKKNLFNDEIILPPRGIQKIPVSLTNSPALQKSKPVHIECGNSFNAVLLDNGELLTFGMGECGEMSRKLPPLQVNGKYDKKAVLNDYLTPKPVLFATPTNLLAQTVNSVACGAFHMLVATQDVTATSSDNSFASLCIYSCGLNNYGQLGHGDFKNRSILTKI